MLMRLAIFCTLICWASLAIGSADTQKSPTLWAFGDTHGAFDALVNLLQNNQLIDQQLNWSGGNAILVSTGDVLDRGPAPRKILDLMMKLERQAKAAGGHFQLVLGNHEVMILVGDLRYVAPAEYAEFAADESSHTRDKYFQQYLRYHQKKRSAQTPPKKGQAGQSKPIDRTELRAQFDRQHPAGFFARFEAFSPKGKYGQWLLEKPVLYKAQQNLFTHGGLSATLIGKNLAKINDELKAELRRYINDWHQLIRRDHLPVGSSFHQRESEIVGLKAKEKNRFDLSGHEFMFSSQSPTWYRGAVYCHPYYEQASIDALFDQFDIKRLFLGHTVTDSRQVETRLEGKVFMMDTGMLAQVYQGRANLIKIEPGQTTVFDHQGKTYQPLAAKHQTISYPPQLTLAEVADILQHGEISKVESLNTGITEPYRLTFNDPRAKVRAAFKYIDTDPGMQRRRSKDGAEKYADRYHYDIAAYRLSDMLGFRLVPMAFKRTVNNIPGAVKFWVEDSYNLYTAEQKGWKYEGHCSFEAQMNLMRVFDLLIYNKDPNPTNILVEQVQGQLIWIDHSRAFSTHRKLPEDIDTSNIELTPSVRAALQSLEADALRKVMHGLLNRDQVRALLRRRDKILELDPE